MEEENFGLMDHAYFVGKKEVLQWINKTTKLDVQIIEQLGTGAVHCAIIDAYCEKVVPMGKVNWKARSTHEFIPNLRIMQKALVDLGYEKKVDIEKIARAKYQDNLEFAQWMKKVFEAKTPRESYDPVARRGGATLFYGSESEKKIRERPIFSDKPPVAVEAPKRSAHSSTSHHSVASSKKDPKSSASPPRRSKEPSSVSPEELEALLTLKEDLEGAKELLKVNMDPSELITQLREHFGITM